MNAKTTKFLAVLAVLAMAFAVFAVAAPSDDAAAAEAETNDAQVTVDGTTTKYATLAEAITAANTAGEATITLLKAVTSATASASPTSPSETGIKVAYTISGSAITLDLAGFKITYGAEATTNNDQLSAIFYVTGSLTVTDSKTTGGVDELTSGSQRIEIFNVETTGTLTINKGTYTSNTWGVIYTCGATTINGGSFTIADKSSKDGNGAVYVDGSNASLEMNAGTLTVPTSSPSNTKLYGVFAKNGATATFGAEGATSGPTISSYYAAITSNNLYPSADVTINAGTFSNAATYNSYAAENTPLYIPATGNVVINGGTFTPAASGYWASIGYAKDSISLTVNGGTFSGEFCIAETFVGTKKTDVANTVVINGGSFASFNADNRDATATVATGSNGILNYLSKTAEVELTGTCTLDAPNTVAAGAKVTIKSGATLTTTGNAAKALAVKGSLIVNGTLDVRQSGAIDITLGTATFNANAVLNVSGTPMINAITDVSSTSKSTFTIVGNSAGGWDATLVGNATLAASYDFGKSNVKDTMTIAADSILTVADSKTLTIGASGILTVNGTIVPKTNGSPTLTNNGLIEIGSNGKIGTSDTLQFKSGSTAGDITGAVYAGTGKNVFMNLSITDSVPTDKALTGKIYNLTSAYTSETALTLASGSATIVAPTLKTDITVTTGSITIQSTYTGTITTGADGKKIEFDNVTGSFTVTKGSDKIHGTIESGTVRVLNANTELDGLLIVEAGASVEIQKGAKLNLKTFTLENAGTIYGEGTLSVTGSGNSGVLVNTGNVYVQIEGEKPVATLDELIAALPGNTTIIVTKDILITKDVIIPEGRTIILNDGVELTVDKDHSLTVIKSIIKKAATFESQTGIIVKTDGAMYIDTSDVLTNVIVEDGGAVVMTKAKTQTISGQSINTDTSVGYGNTLIMDGISIESGNKVYVYGTLVMNNKVTVSSNAAITIYKEGTALVNGTLQNAGTVDVIGKVAVDGTVNVTGTVGKSAYFNVTSEKGYGVVVSLGATFNVSKASNETYTNNLSITKDETFYVVGTLKVSGVLAGPVEDLNQVTIQGVIATAGANVTVYEDATLSVDSITGGMLTVDDLGIFDEDLYALTGSSAGSYNNVITLQGVKNITITESVVTKVNSTGTTKYFYGEMTISGNVSSPVDNGKIGISATLESYTVNKKGERIGPSAYPVGPSKSERFGYIHIADLTLGDDIEMTYNQGTVFVDGAVTVTADGSNFKNASADGKYNSLTVNGSIAMGGKDNKTHKALASTKNLNAVYYIMSDADKNETGYYTSADAAIAIIDTVDDKQITTYGSVAFTGTADLENEESILVTAGSYFEIDGTMAIGKDSNVTNSGTIDVYGTLTIEDYVSSVSGFEPLADVLFENDPSKTYCSLAGAIALGATEITLNRDATVSKDLTIPAGVVVSSDKYSVTVKAGKVLDVIGGLVLTNGTVNLTISTAKSTPNAALVVEGYVVVKDDEPTGYVSLKDKVDGAHYEKKVNGLKRNFISSIEYAALNTLDDNNKYEIKIIGKVAGTEASFIPGKNSTITIYVEDRLAEDKVINQLAVLEIGLAPGASLYVDAAYDETTYVAGQFSGTVTAMTSDGTEESNIVAAGATGIYFDAMAIEKAAGTVYYLYLSGDISGIVTVAAGTVTIDKEYSTYINAAAGDMFTVAEDAELVINSTVYLWLNADLYDHFVVDGLVTIDGASANLYLNDSAVVNGEIDVVNAGTLTVNYDMYVLGDIVISDALGKEGKFYVKDVIYLGEKPTTLGSTGSIVGPGTVDSGVYIVQYPGADLSGAKLNWNVAEEKTNLVSTDYIIDGETYMTVWAMNATVLAFAPIYLEDFEIIGIQNDLLKKVSSTYDAVYWFTDITMEEELETMSDYISTYVPAVYAYTEPTGVKGTITVGVGLTLYVDGVGYTASSSRQYSLDVGMHNVYVEIQSGYVGDKVTIKFNDAPVSAGKITITPDMTDFNLVTTGAEPYTPEPTPEPTPVEEKEWTVTTILLCVLVVLIAIMAVIVALRLNRN